MSAWPTRKRVGSRFAALFSTRRYWQAVRSIGSIKPARRPTFEIGGIVNRQASATGEGQYCWFVGDAIDDYRDTGEVAQKPPGSLLRQYPATFAHDETVLHLEPPKARDDRVLMS